MNIEELNEYIKQCKLHPDGTIRDATGKVVGGIDVDSETYKDIFEKNYTIGFSIVGTSEIKEPPMQ